MKRILIFLLMAGCSNYTPLNCKIPMDHFGALKWYKKQTVVMDSSVPAEHASCIRNAVDTLNKAVKDPILEVGTGSGIVVRWVPDASKFKPEEQAITSVQFSTPYLLKAEVKINSGGFKISNNPGPGEVDCESLILHELGHAVGLGHIGGKSVMHPLLNTQQIRRDLSDVDKDALQCRYPKAPVLN